MKILIFLFLFLLTEFQATGSLMANYPYPTDNPVAKYDLSWTDTLPWKNVLVMDPRSGNPDSLFNNLQNEMMNQGGGVIYFPPGEYYFKDHLFIESNIILRGAIPSRTDKFNPAVPQEELMPIIDARDRRYQLTTRFFFPEYKGIDPLKAFRGIRSKNPGISKNIAILDIEIHNGHIYIGTRESLSDDVSQNNVAGNILVYGNILKNSAVAGSEIPVPGQNEDQIWMDRELGAITVFAGENILIANNRIPKSGESNFLMRNYKLYPSRKEWDENGEMTSRDIWFDFDNRTGIRVNYMPMIEGLRIWKDYPAFEKAWKNGGIEKLVTPGSMATGIVIRDNYIFSTGKGGIKSTGWGTKISFNVIRCFPELPLPTHTGIYMDAFVNDMRAIEVRGWEWTIEGNDYEVYSNYTPEGIKFNDGEGIMHESWENIDIRNSVIRNNVGNQYLCFWRIPVNGLLIEGNRVRTKLKWHAIYVNGQTRFSPDDLVDLPVHNVIIRNNITEGGGIKLLGQGKGNIIENNQHALRNESRIIDETGAKVKNNRGYIIE